MCLNQTSKCHTLGVIRDLLKVAKIAITLNLDQNQQNKTKKILEGMKIH